VQLGHERHRVVAQDQLSGALGGSVSFTSIFRIVESSFHNTEERTEMPIKRQDSGRPATVQSVDRSLELLEAMANLGDVALTDLADATGLPPSTVHRLLATLVVRGWATRDQVTHRYRVGNRLLTVASAAHDRTDRLRELVRPYMERVLDEYDETVNLAVLDGSVIIYVDQVESSRPVRMFSRVGNRVPAHASAAGKALLAFRSEPELDIFLANEPFSALTPRTITDVESLRREVARVRGRGYALDREEYDEGVRCVAAPLLDYTGMACAAMSVSGPTARVKRHDTQKVGTHIAEIAREASAALGYTAGRDW
jgi:IclR family acetate operon transcriptional repressor